MVKKIIISSLIVSSLAAGLVAFAQTTTTTTTPSTTTAPDSAKQMVLQAGPKGNVLLRGTIASVSSGVITVNSWGGAWTVNVSSSTSVLPAAVGNDITKFQTGDYIGVQGTVSTTASWTVNATLVRDWTERQAVVQEQKQNTQQMKSIIQSQTAKNFQGTVSNIASASFTLTPSSGTAYTVNIASGAEILNKNRLTIAATAIKNGDTVRVWGTNTNDTISASIVRDVSITK